MSLIEIAHPVAPPEGPAAHPVNVVRRRRRPSGDPPPLPRTVQPAGVFWVAFTLAATMLWVLITVGTPMRQMADRVDLLLLEGAGALRSGPLTAAMRGINVLSGDQSAAVLRWAVVLGLLAFRRWRHLFVFFAALVASVSLTELMASLQQRMRPPVATLAAWEGFSSPSVVVAGLATTCIGVAYGLCVAGRARRAALIGGGAAVALLGAARVYLGVDHPSDVLFGATFGLFLPLLGFHVFTPEGVFPVAYRRGRTAHLAIDERRLTAISEALEAQLGMVVRAVRPFGLSGSAGSTPLRISVAGDDGPTDVFAKLYAVNHLRADRWYKLGRALLYGRLEDEAPFENVRRLVQYEDYLLRVFCDAGLPVAKPYGFVEITPEREYLLVTEFMEGASESGEVDASVAVIDDALRVVRRMWDAGVAHRDIKPANVMVRGGEIVLIDVAFSQIRPSPWRQAVDLANMMIVLALQSDAELVYDRAARIFTPREIAEAFAATSEATRPSLRKMMRADGRDLLRRFRALAPPHPPIRVQRWSARRLWLTARVAVVALLVTLFTITQFQVAGLL